MNVHDLPTPALLLDADIFTANLEAMARHAKASGKRLRPHAKAHKCVEIARRQIEAGAAGVCVATVSEAELMTRAGIPDVLLTSPIADPAKCARLAALANLTVVVDHAQQAAMYNEAAGKAGITLNVLVDLDVGDHRTGIAPGQAAIELVEVVRALPHLTFGGLQAYSVRASHFEGVEARAKFSDEALHPVLLTRQALESRGNNVPLVTGGSTGSYAGDCAAAYLDEIQAGSYALMDVAYGRIGGIEFGNAMTVLGTVISANYPGHVTVDAGFKAFSTDRPFGPEVHPGVCGRYEWAGDEFGYVFPADSQQIGLGDRLRFIPPHCDPTVNLYDRIHVCRGDKVEDVWPIMDRFRPGIR